MMHIYGNCEVYTCKSKGECDEKLFDRCEAFTHVGIPALIVSSRHSETGIARFILEKLEERGLEYDENKWSNIHFMNAFKSQSFKDIVGKIMTEVNCLKVKFVLLDDCTTDPKSYIPFAKAYELSMLALVIEEPSNNRDNKKNTL